MNEGSVKQVFGKHAKSYITSSIHARGESLEQLVALVDPKPGWKALDIATGAGHTAYAFAPHVTHVWATDITSEMLEATEQGARQRGLDNITTEYAHADNLPYEGDSFDLVTCRLAAHHFPDISAFLGAARRVLSKGGKLAVVDNIVPPGPAGDYINAFDKLRDNSHRRSLTMDEWQEAIQDAGLELLHHERIFQPITFEYWGGRHDAIMQNYLRAMLTQAPAEALVSLQPHTTGDDLVFYFQEGILVGSRKGN